MANWPVKRVVGKAVALMAVPWAAFVAVFLYYTVLTMLAISVAQLSDVFMAVAYGLPVGIYGVVVARRCLAMVIHMVASGPALIDQSQAVLLQNEPATFRLVTVAQVTSRKPNEKVFGFSKAGSLPCLFRLNPAGTPRCS